MADALPADLAKVDPADAWLPYRPSAAVPWNKKWIAHFYRRAAFGPSPADTERALTDGFEKTLDRLLTGEPDAPQLLELLSDAGHYLKSDLQIRVWWLSVMLEGGHPLREKLTLFWHNHFATSYAKVQRTQLMFEQNAILRKHALGRFRPFLLAMSQDTAMLKWLDSNQNVKGAPNENFAREVMELFSLGVGNYTEKDIQEAARAFTGWHTDSRIDEDEDTFHFKPVLHDEGQKTVFGKTGNWNGDDVIRLCCDKADCAAFLVGKLYSFLVSETRPPKELLAPLEERFRKSDYDIADLVKTMLGSRLFFSQHAYRKRVKWPVEYALGAVRAATPGRAPLGDLVDPLAKMGQVLFAPPNVKGWRTGTDWLNSATLLARNNFAETVATGGWRNVSVRNNGSKAAFATATPAVAVADVATPPVPYPAQGSAAVAGAAAAATFPTITSPDGMIFLAPVAAENAPGGSAPGSPSSAGGGPPPKGVPGPAAPPPPPELKFDTTEILFKPKPKDVSVLVARMGELLYGDAISAAARIRIEKFLLDGKKSLSAKDLENPAFRQKAREALHALMCLPEYQLN
jgi:hypothetical protein